MLVVNEDARAVAVSGVVSVGDVGAVGATNVDAGATCGGGEDLGDGGGDGEEAAMTRNVVRSNKTTSVAPHAVASVPRCLDRI